ncbi:hypothetical protein [Aureimonas glaciei]|uniref:Uncharacterized protein n=1 Tax=Aureimonas glaciei TaxID=1776957 RepID=A0A917DKM3_9HYPH|nr:hypothetical protein [Aureimonas glaciei]GGD43785.1 hypothetical protein GCM10011335_53020 [Aureimonas glaciei]
MVHDEGQTQRSKRLYGKKSENKEERVTVRLKGDVRDTAARAGFAVNLGEVPFIRMALVETLVKMTQGSEAEDAARIKAELESPVDGRSISIEDQSTGGRKDGVVSIRISSTVARLLISACAATGRSPANFVKWSLMIKLNELGYNPLVNPFILSSTVINKHTLAETREKLIRNGRVEKIEKEG